MAFVGGVHGSIQRSSEGCYSRPALIKIPDVSQERHEGHEAQSWCCEYDGGDIVKPDERLGGGWG